MRVTLARLALALAAPGTVQATEEAIVNALVAAHASTGADGYTIYGLPHRELQSLLKRHGRLELPGQ